MPRVALTVGRLDVEAGEVARLHALLDADEQARAARFRFERDRRRFVVRRGRRRELLGQCVGAAPHELRFAADAFGKPRLLGNELRFSSSHSGEHWAVAAGGVDLGLDFERIEPAIDHRGLAAALFAPAEQAALNSLTGTAAVRGFFDCWARKEAFVKAIGLGLSHPLDAFEVSVGAEPLLRRGGTGWAIAAPALDPALACALVAVDDGGPLAVEVHCWGAETAIAA
ncbi:MAG: 4'-phosphopantetheinyl transferase family protein [Sphingomonas sp.]